jgi:hypothetical protein
MKAWSFPPLSNLLRHVEEFSLTLKHMSQILRFCCHFSLFACKRCMGAKDAWGEHISAWDRHIFCNWGVQAHDDFNAYYIQCTVVYFIHLQLWWCLLFSVMVTGCQCSISSCEPWCFGIHGPLACWELQFPCTYDQHAHLHTLSTFWIYILSQWQLLPPKQPGSLTAGFWG